MAWTHEQAYEELEALKAFTWLPVTFMSISGIEDTGFFLNFCTLNPGSDTSDPSTLLFQNAQLLWQQEV